MRYNREEIVFLNGRFLPAKEANVPVSDPGFLLGAGVFETMRSYNNSIAYFHQHLRRMAGSLRLVNIKLPYSLLKLEDTVNRTVKINNFKDSYIRLTAWRAEKGTGVLVTVKKYNPCSRLKYKVGFKAGVSGFCQNEGCFSPRIKTTSYMLYNLAYEKAKKNGFDEAIILNSRGYLSEASRSNIFLIKNNAVFGPSLSSGCLAGITRKAVFDLAEKHNIKNYEANLTLGDLYKADEAFLTNSLIGVMPLACVGKRRIAGGAGSFKLTRFFIREYNRILKKKA
ncbi:MAG: aminotransferase class IV [Candidatus Omnitrophota bacterium]